MAEAEYHSTSNFEVNIEGMKAKQFTAVEGLQVDIESLPYQEGAMHTQQSKKGRTRHGNITLSRRFSADKELMGWIQDCSKSKVTKRAMSVILKNDSGQEVMRFNATNAWPVSWRGPSFSTSQENQVSLEHLTLDIETLEMA